MEAGAPGAGQTGASVDDLAGLRVGIVAISLSQGGAERQAALWATLCGERSAGVRVLALNGDEPRYPVPNGVDVEVAGKGGRGDLAGLAARVRRFARGADVLAVFQPYAGLLCALARPRAPWLLVTGQDPRAWRDTSRVPARALRWAFGRADALSAPSHGLVACHVERRLGRADAWHTVPNVVDEAAFAVPEADRAGALFVGRLKAEKGPLEAVRAAAAAETPLTVVGDGPLREAVAAEAARLGVEETVTLRPFAPDPWSLYASHRALVVSSRYEAFGNVIVESLAAGTPVASADCDFGPREILRGARYSELVAPATGSAGLAAALRRLTARAPTRAVEEESRAIAEHYRGRRVATEITTILTELARSTA